MLRPASAPRCRGRGRCSARAVPLTVGQSLQRSVRAMVTDCSVSASSAVPPSSTSARKSPGSIAAVLRSPDDNIPDPSADETDLSLPAWLWSGIGIAVVMLAPTALAFSPNVPPRIADIITTNSNEFDMQSSPGDSPRTPRTTGVNSGNCKEADDHAARRRPRSSATGSARQGARQATAKEQELSCWSGLSHQEW